MLLAVQAVAEFLYAVPITLVAEDAGVGGNGQGTEENRGEKETEHREFLSRFLGVRECNPVSQPLVDCSRRSGLSGDGCRFGN
jgi:hypothetical protein